MSRRRQIKYPAALLVFAVSLLLFGLGVAGPITADHTSVQAFPGISPTRITDVKGMVILNIGQSHGEQLPYGLQALASQNGDYAVTVYNTEITGPPNGTLRVGQGLRLSNGSWQTYNDHTDFWATPAGMDNVRRTLNYYAGQGITVDAILHTWCWDLQSMSAGEVDAYFAAMEQLESEYPAITFIYMTDTDDSTGAAGYNRHLRNQQIRAYAQANSKVLFDFGELETWSSDGLSRATYLYGSETVPVWHSDWQGSPQTGHISNTACVMKAKAMWWLLAEINDAATPAPPVSVHRFYKFRDGAHFYTANQAEATHLNDYHGDTYRYEFVAYTANPDPVSGATPVYRFYNFLQGVHFYTNNYEEYLHVQAEDAWTFKYEGVSYYAYATSASGRKPVYRFYNFLQGVHFYTISEIEREQLLTTGAWTYRSESIAYYVPE